MERIKIAHFKKATSPWYGNGGKLCLDGIQVMIRRLGKTIVTFDSTCLQCKIAPDHVMGYKTVVLSDGKSIFECLFFKKIL